jgi:hypothetical protein
VWTTKRVLLLAGGLIVFLVAYQVYAHFLGGIDGLTPLPPEYGPPDNTDPTPPDSDLMPPTNLADRKLQQAFGPGKDEDPDDPLKCAIKLDLRSRGIVLAVNVFEPEADGRVRLQPFNMAIFGKTQGPGPTPEINTIRSKVAFLTFDQPVKSIAELSNRKIVAAELRDTISVTNNRRTVPRDDDLFLYTEGPMFYKEDQHRIWTEAEVKLGEFHGNSDPTKITADGMDLFLTTETATSHAMPSGAHKAKPKGESISGVDHIVLRANVEMHLFVDSRSGFLAPGKPNPNVKAGQKAVSSGPAALPASPAEKSEVVIQTDGPFRYDATTDRARFDIPDQPGSLKKQVTVTRINNRNKRDAHDRHSNEPHDPNRRDDLAQSQNDWLECEHLELQFRRKGTAPSAADTDRSSADGLEIETAHATGTNVELESYAETLHAYGNDLFHDARKRLSILKGDPEMVALKDGNEIHARALWLQTTDVRNTHEATAIGPGYVGMLDRTEGAAHKESTTMERTLQARWTDKLLYQKDGNLDCLTLTGDAAFIDLQHGQQLRAQRLKVWLEPADPGSPVPAEGEQQRLRPQHLEAKGRVTADAPEMHIKEPTEDLIIWFKDAPPQTQTPTTGPPAGDNKPGSPTGKADATAGPADKTTATTAAPATTPPPAAPADKRKPPIDLSARLVKVYVLRQGNKNDLDRLWCEGSVSVHQEPASADDQGVDIQGETLDLTHTPDGGILTVTGKWAQVQIDKIAILGPEVHIDQQKNKAWVDGIGAMQMLNKTSFDGKVLPKPTELTVHWKEAMLFNGTNAEFRGGVQAEQENSRLLCQELQAAFDRPVSLKEGRKDGPQPKVDKLLCDKNVQIEDVTRQGAFLVGYKRLVAPLVDLDNAEGIVTAPGPGEVRIFQLGSADDTFGQSGGPGAAPQDRTKRAASSTDRSGGKTEKETKQEFKLTHVRFRDRMQANNKQRTANFLGAVEAINVPTGKPDLKVDIDKPPPGCIYLKCENLHILTNHLPDGRASQELIARRKVLVQAQGEFWGVADIVKYDELQQRVIFEGTDGNMATLYRIKGQGGQQEKITGRKIIYWRQTGDWRIEDGSGINVVN